MVSVRNAAEATTALNAGADMIDVKEPSRGALGAADWTAIAEIIKAVQGRCPISVALGELSHGLPDLDGFCFDKIDYVKIGLHDVTQDTDWLTAWSNAIERLARVTSLVAVAYVDDCYSPTVDFVCKKASSVGCKAILLDTFHKDGRQLFDHRTPEQVSTIIHAANDVAVVLAGALNRQSLFRAAQLSPFAVAVRSAACVSDRVSEIDGNRVSELKQIVRKSVCSGDASFTFASAKR